MRLIIELPHEVSPIGRYLIAREFCKTFEERGLPYWAVGHKPAPFGDQRNYHLHIAYYDRPCSKLPDERWDIEDRVVKVSSAGKVTVSYPHLQNKDREAQGRPWMLRLREQYATAANRILAKEGHQKRYTPKSYKALGIDKTPGRHISQAAFNLERQGVSTVEGRHNRSAQLQWVQRQHQSAIEIPTKKVMAEAGSVVKRCQALPGSSSVLARFLPDMERQERIIVTSSRKAVSAHLEADSSGGYARLRTRFFRTLLAEIHDRVSAGGGSLSEGERRQDYRRVQNIVVEARQASDVADVYRGIQRQEAEQHMRAAAAAAVELARLTGCGKMRRDARNFPVAV